MRIALSRMDQVWEDKRSNLRICDALAERASGLGADMLIFPEMTLTGFTLNTHGVAEPADGSPSMQSFSEMAAKHHLGIIAGMVLESHGRSQNCAVAFGRNGERMCRFAKIHPFSPAGENRHVTGGDELSAFAYEGFELGLTICYDLRFPVLWHALAERSDCIINIANWPARRMDHWSTLLKARAIENQVYVIGVNRVGVDGNGLEYTESSLAFAPDGTEIAPVEVDDAISLIEIERAAVKNCQDGFPVRNDRRNALYDKFLNARAKS